MQRVCERCRLTSLCARRYRHPWHPYHAQFFAKHSVDKALACNYQDDSNKSDWSCETTGYLSAGG